MQWHPVESPILLSAAYDRTVRVTDVRDAACAVRFASHNVELTESLCLIMATFLSASRSLEGRRRVLCMESSRTHDVLDLYRRREYFVF